MRVYVPDQYDNWVPELILIFKFSGTYYYFYGTGKVSSYYNIIITLQEYKNKRPNLLNGKQTDTNKLDSSQTPSEILEGKRFVSIF